MLISVADPVSRNLRPRLNDQSLEEEDSESSGNDKVEKVQVWVSYEIWQEKPVKEKRATKRGTKQEDISIAYRKSVSSPKGSPDLYSFEANAYNTSPDEFKRLGIIEVDNYVPNLSN